MITAEELLYNTLLKGIINRRGEDYSMKELYARELSRPIPSKNMVKMVMLWRTMIR